MRRIKFVIILLVLPVAAFATYNLWDMVDGGATYSSSSGYKLEVLLTLLQVVNQQVQAPHCMVAITMVLSQLV